MSNNSCSVIITIHNTDDICDSLKIVQTSLVISHSSVYIFWHEMLFWFNASICHVVRVSTSSSVSYHIETQSINSRYYVKTTQSDIMWSIFHFTYVSNFPWKPKWCSIQLARHILLEKLQGQGIVYQGVGLKDLNNVCWDVIKAGFLVIHIWPCFCVRSNAS